MQDNKLDKPHYIIGGYAGNTQLYENRITEDFANYQAALHFKQTYGRFSLSLQEGKIVPVEDEEEIEQNTCAMCDEPIENHKTFCSEKCLKDDLKEIT